MKNKSSTNNNSNNNNTSTTSNNVNSSQTKRRNNSNVIQNENLSNSSSNRNNSQQQQQQQQPRITQNTNVNWAKDFMNWNDQQQQQLQSVGSTVVVHQKDKYFKVVKRSTVIISCLIFVITTLLYSFTQYPSVSGGDAGELIINAYQFGIAHPPGYPLFTALGYIFSHAFPSSQLSVAWKVSLMSSMIGAIGSVLIYLTVYLWVNDHWSGILASGLFTFSPLIWMYHIQGEVFSLNNTFTALLLFLSIWFTRVRIYENERYNASFWTSERIAYLSAFLCGLGLTNQHTLVLIVAPFAFWIMFIAGRDQLWSMKIVSNLSICALSGLSPYLFLFVAPKLNKVKYSWGNTSTISGFITHFLRSEYGTLQLYSGDEGNSISLLPKIFLYFENLVDQFTIIGVILALIGFLNIMFGYNLKTFKWKSIGTMIGFTFLFYITFFFNLCNLPIDKSLYKGVFLRFFMQPNVIVSICIGIGSKSLFRFANNSNNNILKKILLPLLVLGLVGYQVSTNYSLQDQSKNYSFHDFGYAILDSLPKNALLLAGGDLVTNVPQYLHLCEKARPDIDIISLEIMSWDWFTVTQGPLYSRVNFPGSVYHPYKTDGYSLKLFLDYNQHRPIFIVGDFKHGDNSFQSHYFTVNRGMAQQIFHVSQKQDLNLYQMIRQSFSKMPEFNNLPNDTVKYPADSWEHHMINDIVSNLEKSVENLLSHYLSLETVDSDKALELSIDILTKALELNPTRCWALKHMGVTYDHLRYRLMKPTSNSADSKHTADKAESYSKSLLTHWSKYIEHCFKERDQDWDTINNVVLYYNK
ncbi:hypothetical protein CYY_002094 [Polysphondylium violaceum]|uniref:Transmembrane protein n=1 Tax=Polysphondylium violaceum TaxID=133409 RepID=A0A8J4PXC2_9MYCE|nr:hypothetical protein CYY_002094 [Polysphondylium violaceum]